jgi:hypothetical protein
MKTYICLILAALTCNCAMAQLNLSNLTWKMTLKVVDEQGNPVSAANAGVGFYTNSQPTSINGITDTNGLFSASETVEPSGGGYLLGFSAEKDGYYTTRSELELDAKYDPIKWNTTQTLVLRKVGKPIAMYAKWIRSEPPVFKKTGIPPIVLNTNIGYDLTVGDWVAPYGKGANTDINFTEEFNKRSAFDFSYKLTVSFPNAGDGIMEYTEPESETGSGLRSPHEAPIDGYKPKLIKLNSAHPGEAGKSDYDPNRIYLFRVRTAIDHEGNIVSAHYGKIYGDFMQFSYYLNPTPNDRNIEFDPKQNLFGGLQSFEQVSAP